MAQNENAQAGLAVAGAATSLVGGISALGAGSAAGAAGAGAAGGSVLGPIGMIAGAVIGLAAFGLGMGAASARNRQIRQALRAKYEQINMKINESRLAFYDQTMRNAKDTADMVDKTKVALSGFGSGMSNNEYVAQIVADKEYDQVLLRRQQQGLEAQAEYEKKVSYAEAKSGAVSPISQGLIMGAQGFQTGMALGSAVEGLAKSVTENRALSGLQTQAQWESDNLVGGISPETNVAIAAVANGVRPSMVWQNGAVNTNTPAYQAFYQKSLLDEAQLRYFQTGVRQAEQMNQMFGLGLQAQTTSYSNPNFANVAGTIAQQRSDLFRNYGVNVSGAPAAIATRGGSSLLGSAPSSSIFDFMRPSAFR